MRCEEGVERGSDNANEDEAVRRGCEQGEERVCRFENLGCKLAAPVKVVRRASLRYGWYMPEDGTARLQDSPLDPQIMPIGAGPAPIRALKPVRVALQTGLISYASSSCDRRASVQASLLVLATVRPSGPRRSSQIADLLARSASHPSHRHRRHWGQAPEPDVRTRRGAASVDSVQMVVRFRALPDLVEAEQRSWKAVRPV